MLWVPDVLRQWIVWGGIRIGGMSSILAVAVSNVEVEVYQCIFMCSQSITNQVVKWSETGTDAEAREFLRPSETLEDFGDAQHLDGVAVDKICFVKG